MFRSIDLCVLRDACHELICAFGNFFASGTQDAKLPKSLEVYCICSVTIIRFSLYRPFKKEGNLPYLNNFTGLCLFLKSQKYFLNISLVEGVTLQNVLVMNELSSFRKVAAKLALNKHGLQVLFLFTHLVLLLAETMTKIIATSSCSLRY